MVVGKNFKKIRLLILRTAILSIIIYPVTALAVGESATTSEDGNVANDIELTFEVKEGDFEYEIENRPDPFVPFYTGETNTQPEVDPNEIVEVEKRLTGMQLFEPGQLTLVGLMKVQNRYVAMVEDFKGQGYIIKEGTKIGRRGIVKDIIPNKVLIEEVAVTRAGRELRNEIVMALRKEGEE
ncbi:MAG: pilus assembly protein PilP [Desulfocapsaceae bacterium]|nr:pilus assembly protein PilP [Desulfocapsaceae bacterium]